MQQDNRAPGGVFEVFDHARKVKRARLGIPVAVAFVGEPSLARDSVLVTPGWVGSVDDSFSREKLSQELEADTGGSSSRKTLGGGHEARA